MPSSNVLGALDWQLSSGWPEYAGCPHCPIAAKAVGWLWQLPRQDPGVWGFQPSQLRLVPHFCREQVHKHFRTNGIAHSSLRPSIVNKDSVRQEPLSGRDFC